MHTGVQTLTDNEMNTHSLTDKIDQILDQKTKSIVGVITGGQLDNYHKIFSNKP